jgi:plasmid stabilization system protein ParE
MRVVWSPLAVERVTEIAAYIARDRPRAAARWVELLFSRVGQVRDFARSGRRVPEVARADVREIVHGNYRIIFASSRGVWRSSPFVTSSSSSS